MDHEGQKKIIYLKPGEMLFYESAKVPHGRQFPLEGEFYDIKLVHFYLDEETWWKSLRIGCRQLMQIILKL